MPSLTLDNELELIFDPALIPAEVRAALPAELHVRPLAVTDHGRGHLAVLSVLSPSPDMGATAYAQAFAQMRASPSTYYAIVIVNRDTDRIVATGTLFVELKFLRKLGKVGHIEDIAVDTNQQGKKLGLRIIQALTGISESVGCYKTILNCSESNIPFYQKCGYEKREVEMAKYAPGHEHHPPPPRL